MSTLFIACKHRGKLSASADLSKVKSCITADAFYVSVMKIKPRVNIYIIMIFRGNPHCENVYMMHSLY
jgi:hypothetical protein